MSEFATMPIWEIQIEAIGKCCEVVIAKPNELQFDLDSEDARVRCHYWIQTKFFDRFHPKEGPKEWRSKNGNWHVVVTLPEVLAVPERIALQSQGGSDPGREFAALCCHWDGSPHPILLYKPLPKLLCAGGIV